MVEERVLQSLLEMLIERVLVVWYGVYIILDLEM